MEGNKIWKSNVQSLHICCRWKFCWIGMVLFGTGMAVVSTNDMSAGSLSYTGIPSIYNAVSILWVLLCHFHEMDIHKLLYVFSRKSIKSYVNCLYFSVSIMWEYMACIGTWDSSENRAWYSSMCHQSSVGTYHWHQTQLTIWHSLWTIHSIIQPGPQCW